MKGLHVAGEQACTGPLAKIVAPRCFAENLAPLYETEWVVYAKPPFDGPEKLLAYLARYTHRIAISNHRLLRLEGEADLFTWRDRAHGDRQRTMRLHAHEFLRRLLLHVLPDGFVRIRSYGLLANRGRHETLARCREALGAPPAEAPAGAEATEWCELVVRITGTDPGRCPDCRRGRLLLVAEVPAQGRDPPRLRRTS